MSDNNENNLIQFPSSSPVQRRPHVMPLTDSQAYNLCCGLLLSRFTKPTAREEERNEEVTELFTRSFTDTYQIYLVTNRDGRPRHPGSVSVYLLGGEAAPQLAIPSLNIELVLRNTDAQPFFSSSSLPGPLASLSLQSTRDFVLNHCPITSINVETILSSLSVVQQYRPAHADTSEDGSITIYHEQNLRLAIDQPIALVPGMQEHLCDLELTWKEKEQLYMADTEEVEEFNYLCGEIQIEAGKNTYYPSGLTRNKIDYTPTALLFGDPNSRDVQKEIAAILDRGTELPAGASTEISGTEQAERKGGYVEFTVLVPNTPGATADWTVDGNNGLGATWAIAPSTDSAGAFTVVRHRTYVVSSGNWNTDVAVYDPFGERATVTVSSKPVSEPTAPRPATGQTKYYVSKLALVDYATIEVIAQQTPEHSDHLVLVDDATIEVIAHPVPPEVNDGLALIDEADIEVIAHPLPEHSDKLTLTDAATIEVVSPPVPNVSEHLSLVDNAEIEIV